MGILILTTILKFSKTIKKIKNNPLDLKKEKNIYGGLKSKSYRKQTL